MIGRVVLRMRSGTDPGTQVPFVTGALDVSACVT